LFFKIVNQKHFFVILNFSTFFLIINDVDIYLHAWHRKKMKKKKKMTRHYHVGDYADSMGSGDNPEESSFFKGGI